MLAPERRSIAFVSLNSSFVVAFCFDGFAHFGRLTVAFVSRIVRKRLVVFAVCPHHWILVAEGSYHGMVLRLNSHRRRLQMDTNWMGSLPVLEELQLLVVD